MCWHLTSERYAVNAAHTHHRRTGRVKPVPLGHLSLSLLSTGPTPCSRLYIACNCNTRRGLLGQRLAAVTPLGNSQYKHCIQPSLYPHSHRTISYPPPPPHTHTPSLSFAWNYFARPKNYASVDGLLSIELGKLLGELMERIWVSLNA